MEEENLAKKVGLWGKYNEKLGCQLKPFIKYRINNISCNNNNNNNKSLLFENNPGGEGIQKILSSLHQFLHPGICVSSCRQ